MAMNTNSVHVVYVEPKTVDMSGNVIDKTDASTTIGTMLRTSMDHRIVPTAEVASSANWPSIKTYLKLEAAGGYVALHISQTMIVTYKQSDLNTP
jgi:predicted aspartyl protease